MQWASGLTVAFSFAADPYNSYEVASDGEIPIGDWTHLVGTWDGTTLSLYLNGVLNAQGTPGAAPWGSGGAFHIGGIYDPEGDCAYVGQFFYGLIDEVSYYARNCSRCTHLRNMMVKSAALGQGVLAKK